MTIAAMMLAATLTGCGGGGGDGGAGGDGAGSTPQTGPTIQQYYPLAVGHRWVYDEEGVAPPLNPAFIDRWTDEVTGVASTGGETVLRVESTDPLGTVSARDSLVYRADGLWRLPPADADEIVRALGPQRLMNAANRPGETFVQNDRTVEGDWDLDGKPDRLTVRSTVTVVERETVTVPAGTFAEVLHLRTDQTETLVLTRTNQTYRTESVAHDWYAPGVGPVRARYELRSEGQVSHSLNVVLKAFHVGDRRSETTPPVVVSVAPAADATTGGAGTPVTVEFSEAIARSSARDGITVRNAEGERIAGTTDMIADRWIAFVPGESWKSGTYTATLSAGVEDLAGNPLGQSRSWTFTMDNQGPGLLRALPADKAKDVPRDAPLTVTFTEPIDPASLSEGRVTLWLENTSQRVDADVSLSGAVLMVRPKQALMKGMDYLLAIQDLRDGFGNGSGTLQLRFTTDLGVFASAVRVAPGDLTISSTAIGDLNGDGFADVVLADQWTVVLRYGQPDGTLGPAVKLDASLVPCQVDSVAIGDVNGDGRQDLVLGGNGCGVQLLLQDAHGALVAGPVLPAADASHVRIVDVNGDGRMDIVSAGYASPYARIALQAVDGSFPTLTLVPISFQPHDMEVADVNGDGRPDLLLVGFGQNAQALEVHLQQPDGSFGAAIHRDVEHAFDGGSVAVGDVNGDGRDDVIVTRNSNAPTSIHVFLQQPDGQLSAGSALDSYEVPASVRIVDLDGDGRKDVVVSHAGWNAIGVYWQQADGTLSQEDRIRAPTSGGRSRLLSVGDLNRDGKPDLLVGGTLLMQKPTTVRPNGRGLRPGSGAPLRATGLIQALGASRR